MGFCLSPGSICKDKTSAINVHRSIGIENQSSKIITCNSKKNYYPKYYIQDIGYKIKINLVFFCDNNILKNSFTYKFQLYIDNSEIEEENFISLGSTEAMICQNKIKYNKIFETNYHFSKEQRIKICCLENEKNINTSSYYLGKMINTFENPKLIIEKDNIKIGELLILINKEENSKLFKNKKCIFYVELPNKVKITEEGNYFFCINNNYNEIIFKSNEFNYNNQNDNANDLVFKFSFEIRKHFIFYKSKSIQFNLYLIKSKNNNNIKNIEENDINKNKEINKNEDVDKINDIKYELIGSIDITNEELLKNNGNNNFKLSNGILSSLFKDSIIININYKEKDYTPFLEYIKFQLHLNLILVFDNNKLTNNTQIKSIANTFFSILSLYNNEEQKIIYIRSDQDLTIKKATNIKECFDNKDKNDDDNEVNDDKGGENKIIPIIDILFQNYILSQINNGINKYFIILIFTDKQYSDLNIDTNDILDDKNIYQKYENFPLNIKVFNSNNENNYHETNNINMNIFHNSIGDIKYERKIFQFYNIYEQSNKNEKGNKYLNDIPFLIEDFFEIQKSSKFSIFDE